MKKSENKRLFFIKVPIWFKILNLPNSIEFSELVPNMFFKKPL